MFSLGFQEVYSQFLFGAGIQTKVHWIQWKDFYKLKKNIML